jgi:hypothetical protein
MLCTNLTSGGGAPSQKAGTEIAGKRTGFALEKQDIALLPHSLNVFAPRPIREA